MSRDGQHSHHANLCLRQNVPNNSAVVVLHFGRLGIPILTQGGPNVKHGQHASDDEVHRPKGEVPAGTDPGNHE